MRDEARRAWQRQLRVVWALCPRMDITEAARKYDGLSTDGLELLRESALHTRFDVATVLAAFAGDEAILKAVARSEGEVLIQDYLDMWRHDLVTLRSSRSRPARRPATFRRGWRCAVSSAPRRPLGRATREARRRDRDARPSRRATS
jgi:hypothetical protein